VGMRLICATKGKQTVWLLLSFEEKEKKCAM